MNMQHNCLMGNLKQSRRCTQRVSQIKTVFVHFNETECRMHQARFVFFMESETSFYVSRFSSFFPAHNLIKT